MSRGGIEWECMLRLTALQFEHFEMHDSEDSCNPKTKLQGPLEQLDCLSEDWWICQYKGTKVCFSFQDCNQGCVIWIWIQRLKAIRRHQRCIHTLHTRTGTVKLCSFLGAYEMFEFCQRIWTNQMGICVRFQKYSELAPDPALRFFKNKYPLDVWFRHSEAWWNLKSMVLFLCQG